MDEICDVEIVRQIIEGELKKSTKVHKYLIIEEIKDRFNHIKIVNKVYYENRIKADGVKNFNAGAKKIFRDSFRSLKKDFYMAPDGFIAPIVKKQRGRPLGKVIYYEYNGESKTISGWAKSKNILRKTLLKRIADGQTIQQALDEPVESWNGRREVPVQPNDGSLVVEFWQRKDTLGLLYIGDARLSFRNKNDLSWRVRLRNKTPKNGDKVDRCFSDINQAVEFILENENRQLSESGRQEIEKYKLLVSSTTGNA